MYNTKWLWVSTFLAIVLLCGCGEKPETTMGSEVTTKATARVKINLLEAPQEIDKFLTHKKIPNGDIYLQDHKVHVNIVGLNEEIEQVFADTYVVDNYVLHDVKYTIQDLRIAQELLHENNLYQKLNLYGSDIDVIGNKVSITMPDSSETAAKPEIEGLIAPDMLHYNIEALGQPHVVGKIVEIDTEDRQRILILEPEKDEPTYWFSFNEKSEIYSEAGDRKLFTDLKKGQFVKLWSTGTVEDSLPAQASVRRLEMGL